MSKTKRAPIGRPDEGRVRLTLHVLPETRAKLARLLDKSDREKNTQGKIIDLLLKR